MFLFGIPSRPATFCFGFGLCGFQTCRNLPRSYKCLKVKFRSFLVHLTRQEGQASGCSVLNPEPTSLNRDGGLTALFNCSRALQRGGEADRGWSVSERFLHRNLHFAHSFFVICWVCRCKSFACACVYTPSCKGIPHTQMEKRTRVSTGTYQLVYM